MIWILWKHVHANPHASTDPIPESRILAIEARLASLEDHIRNPNPFYVPESEIQEFLDKSDHIIKLSELVSMAYPELTALAAQHEVEGETREDLIRGLCSVLETEDDLNTEENDNE